MELLIVTGMSGSGKSVAINALEDLGFYCVDNLPPQFILSFAKLSIGTKGKEDRLALVVDARSKNVFTDLYEEIRMLDENKIRYKLLFLDASDETLLNRYKETRRKHPMMGSVITSLDAAIDKERSSFETIRSRADYILDTTFLSSANLKKEVIKLFQLEGTHSMQIKTVSFGYKYGIPNDADLVFDLRYLPNPYYVPELREKTGENDEVYNYVMETGLAQTLFVKLMDLIEYLVPLYIEEGKSQLVIAYGCTGGKHRSVSFARKTAEFLTGKNCSVVTQHRDIDRI
ncbi:MAG TPA: RNase adapter RapZ [Clostridiaceae bacterium]|nr:RNase adapter RapZ [Clostridiaceae bacterium]